MQLSKESGSFVEHFARALQIGPAGEQPSLVNAGMRLPFAVTTNAEELNRLRECLACASGVNIRIEDPDTEAQSASRVACKCKPGSELRGGVEVASAFMVL